MIEFAELEQQGGVYLFCWPLACGLTYGLPMVDSCAMGSTPGTRRDPPVSFRPGKLRAAIKHRALRNLPESQIVKRDLGRYYLLLGQALGEVHLTRREASWLAAAQLRHDVEDELSGDPFIPEHRNPSDYLLAVVKRPITRAEREGRPAGELAYRVADKVESMTPLQRAALLDALDRLPAESEEEIYDPGNWALIGIPLAEDPLTAEDVVNGGGQMAS